MKLKDMASSLGPSTYHDWAHHLSSLVFGVFLCKIKMKTLYTIPTSQGCCENQVKMYVKALCNFVIF